jgi:hypothetical protein
MICARAVQAVWLSGTLAVLACGSSSDGNGGGPAQTAAGAAGAPAEGGAGGLKEGGGSGAGAIVGQSGSTTTQGGQHADPNGGSGGSPDGPLGGAAGNEGDRGGEGGLAVCEKSPDSIEGCLLSPSAALVTSGVITEVTVLGITDVANGACAATNFDDSSQGGSGEGQTRRLELRAPDAREWTLFVRMPSMPADLVQVGDTVDLSLDARQDSSGMGTTTSQTIILAQGDELVLFVATLNLTPFALPNLGSHGIAVSGDAATCQDDASGGCLRSGLAARVSVDSDAKTVEPGHTIEVSNLSFSVETLDLVVPSGGVCDRPGFTQVAGFRVGD